MTFRVVLCLFLILPGMTEGNPVYDNGTLTEDEANAVSDLCTPFTGVGCSAICIVIDQQTVCTCNIGYKLGADNQTCLDINECDTNLDLNQCTQKETCVNTDGGYECSCSVGFHLETDKRTCTDINECLIPILDQCSQVCIDTVGSFDCACHTGFDQNGIQCTASVQCQNVSVCGDNTICTSISGVDTCVCQKGFEFIQYSNTTCEDIPECTIDPHRCSQVCIETDGGYMCVCSTTGYKLDVDQTTCIVCDEGTFGNNCTMNCNCHENNTVECNQVNGTCTCKVGWEGSKCETDIDECDSMPGICPQNSTCENKNGSYSCRCNSGFMTTSDGQCQVCDEGTFGNNCTMNCSCNDTNTVECNHVNGTCTCKTGWWGVNCDTDIGEFDNMTGICLHNSTCDDTELSHSSFCNCGFVVTSVGTCQPCDEGTFGNNCTMNCTCNTNNTVECNHVYGTCTCKAGWEGCTCDNDIDECDSMTNTCPENSTCENTNGSYSCGCDSRLMATSDGQCQNIDECLIPMLDECSQVCIDTIGSFKCACHTGFDQNGTQCKASVQCQNVSVCGDNTLCTSISGVDTCVCQKGFEFIQDSNTTCEDIPECTVNPYRCSQACIETAGGFMCLCNTIGYKLDVDQSTCKACDEGTFGNNCTMNCTCDGTHTAECNHVNGTCTCKTGWEGSKCDTDIDECHSMTNICPQNSTCENTGGSYFCV